MFFLRKETGLTHEVSLFLWNKQITGQISIFASVLKYAYYKES